MRGVTPRKSWAVLAYTIAEDPDASGPLDTAARRELKAICDAADFTSVSIAAQVDFKRRRGVYRGALEQLEPKDRGFEDIRPENHELWKQVKDGVRAGTAAVTLQRERVDLNAARADVLQEFLRFGQKACPAERYLVSFFGHAAGPMGIFNDATSGRRTREAMRLNDLAGACRGGRPADVVLFRDCYMNCLEAAYQLRHAAGFMLASQALAPATGTWPWRQFMRTLRPDASPVEVGLGLATALATFLDDAKNRGGFATVPYSLLALDTMDAVARVLAALVEALQAARRDPSRSRACAAALEGARVGSAEDSATPGDPALLDVPTMCARLAALAGDPVAVPAAALGEIVGSRLVRFHHAQSADHQGTALFYKPVRPRDLEQSYLQATDEATAAEDQARYRALALSRATGWPRIAHDPLPVAA
ncbi:MAG: hypothetical protein IT181_21650 [Acidobacteria bacterium]|nr:hypothetical protein [Acidobacteriota bacterium]